VARRTDLIQHCYCLVVLPAARPQVQLQALESRITNHGLETVPTSETVLTRFRDYCPRFTPRTQEAIETKARLLNITLKRVFDATRKAA
jgi:hypothetical protein